MNAWEIYSYDFPGIGPHPAVVISGSVRASAKPLVEVLRCGSVRAGRQAAPGEVVLDTADGLDWATLCFCDLVWTAERAGLKRRRGLVTPERRRSIVSAILQSHDWVGL